MTRHFKATMDSYSNEITVVVTILTIGIFVAQVIFYSQESIILAPVAVLLLVLYLRALLFRPVSYEIRDGLLVIHRLANDKTLPIKNFRTVNILENEIKYTRKFFTIHGFFGYYGKFANKQLGSFYMYATRRNKKVLIETGDNRKVIVTPDQPARFITHLKAQFT